MKRFLVSALAVLSLGICASAQTVIANDYGTEGQAGISGGTVDADEDVDASYLFFSAGYWDYDDFINYGFSSSVINPGGLGFDMNMRTNFESVQDGGPGNINYDLMLNYTFNLAGNNKTRLDFTMSAGPSLRMQTVIKDVKYSSYGNYTYDTGEKFYLDGCAQFALNAKLGALVLSAGYNLWLPKFKTSSDYRADGFVLRAGYCF